MIKRILLNRPGSTVCALATAALTVVAGIVLNNQLERAAFERHEVLLRNQVLEDLTSVRVGAEVVMNQRALLTLALEYHVSVNPDISTEEFNAFAELLMGEFGGVRSITLLRDTVISDVYPIIGNESAIGFAPLEDPNQRAAAQAAMQAERMTFTGPVELRQGGRAFICRAPVQVANSHNLEFEIGDYWGLVSILVDYDQLAREILALVPEDIQIAILAGPDRELVFGQELSKDSRPLTTEVQLADQTWLVQALPVDGWPQAAPGAEARFYFSILLTCLAALLVYLLTSSAIRYARAASELKSVAEEAQHNEAVLEKTARMAKVGGWKFNILTDEIAWSDEVCRIHERPLGYVPELDEAINYYAPSARPTIREAIKRTVELGEPWDLVLPFITASGRKIWVRTIGEGEFKDGRCERLWGTFQDVTEHHNDQQAMRLTQQAVDNAADAIFFINALGEIEYANDVASDVLGRSLNGRKVGVADNVLSGYGWQEKLLELERNRVCEYETKLSNLDGREFDCDARLWLVEFEGELRVVASYRDTSQTKREVQMRNVLFEQSSDAHLLFDATGIIECNQAAVDMLRMRDKQAVLECHPAEFSPELQPDGRPSLEKCIEMDRLAYENGYHRFDWMHKRSDGEEFLCEVTLNPVQLDSGGALLVVWHDISERKRVIDQMAASNRELQQFAYVASHDLQAPLRGIANFAQFLAEDYSDQLDEAAHNYISRIVSGCKRMQKLISDLLSYSRVDGRCRPFEQVDLGGVVDQVIDVLEPSIVDSGATVTRDKLPTVAGDPSQLLQLFQNLISNGLKYQNQETPKVNISVRRHLQEWIFSVADNGIGIPEESQDRIFEIFKRLHTQEEYPGTGIGLAICQRIAEQHSGRVWVESAPGEGSTFFIALPAKLNEEKSPSENSTTTQLASLNSSK